MAEGIFWLAAGVTLASAAFLTILYLRVRREDRALREQAAALFSRHR